MHPSIRIVRLILKKDQHLTQKCLYSLKKDRDFLSKDKASNRIELFSLQEESMAKIDTVLIKIDKATIMIE